MILADFSSLIEDLSKCRPVFHSEADFQLAFGWYIHEKVPNSQVRLEFKPFHSENMYLDIWLQDSETAIELKYYTRELEMEQNGEYFVLRNQAAYPPRRYDFIRDIQRLERLVRSFEPAKSGLTILLTNDPAYWSLPKQAWGNKVDAAFRIHEGIVLKGIMDWSDDVSYGTKKGREELIGLTGSYNLNWRDYSNLNEGKYGRFRYLVVEVSQMAVG